MINCGVFARDEEAEAENGSGGRGFHSGLKRSTITQGGKRAR